MPQFLTVKEAAQLVGKSSSSIRRIIYPIVQSDQHPDRQLIQPSADEAMQLRMKGENFAWRVSEELLRREIPAESIPGKHSDTLSEPGHNSASGDLLQMLRRELDIKNQQITQQSELIGKQMELISGLSDRIGEGNILIGTLQQRLALTDGREKPATDAVEMKTSEPAAEKAKKSAEKTTKPKKGFFSRLFR